jgi:hypothetical protein
MNLLTHNLLCCPLAAAVQKLPLVIEATEVISKERDFKLDFLKKCSPSFIQLLMRMQFSVILQLTSPSQHYRSHRLACSSASRRCIISIGCV